MIKEPTMPDLVKNEEEILKFWSKNKIFDELKEQNKKTGKYFSFLDGPVTANYPMGLHHAYGRSLKDAEIKYKAMMGYDQHFQNGFDVHGLPMEVAVEKEMGLNSKKDIEAMGIDKFTEACMAKAQNCGQNMTERSIRLGQWMNWDDSYYTNSDENINGIWYFFKKCYEKGYLKKSYKPRPWCVRCGTVLSEHEMADQDAHKEVIHQAVFFKCPIVGSDWSLLVWTTTPWTLSSNVAVAVNKDLIYSVCKVKSTDRKLIVCSTVLKVLKGDLVSVEREISGSELVGKIYETCFPEFEEQQFEHKIVAWDQANATEGTGMVHIAPGCGIEDFELGQSLGLKNVMPIDESGFYYSKGFGLLSGLDAKLDSTRDLIFEELKKRDKMYYTHPHKHVYPHCWRCKQPIMFRLVSEWVIAVDELRPQLIAEAKKVEWQPDFYEKRMLDWLTNMGDWPISRKRYYGVPLPFYVCPECGELTVIGSKDELKKLAVDPKMVDKIPHLHRPYIDEIEIKCPHCGHHVKRVTDVGDTWLDAGITPFTTKKFFSDKKYWDKTYPIDFVCEMKEQIRLWFYSLLIMGVVITGKAPYKKVKLYGSLLAQDGKKLSKSSPNNIPLNEAFDKMGADVIRYNFIGNGAQSDVVFSFDVSDEVRRKLLSFWNVYLFFNTYANLDKPHIAGYLPKSSDLCMIDKWLIERTNEFAHKAQEAYENTMFDVVTNEFEKFVDDLSNWYIRVNRRRFWKSEDNDDKKNAYFCLYYAIKNSIIVLAPIIPFLCEHIWQNMVREIEPTEADSVMLSRFNIAYCKLTNKDELTAKTRVVRDVIAIAGRLRNENQLKIKQPLKTMYLIVDEFGKKAVKSFENIIKDELNIKEIVYETDNHKFNIPYLAIDFKKAGAVLKGDVQKVKTALGEMNEKQMQSVVKQYGEGKLSIAGHNDLSSELFVLMFKPKTEFVIATENGKTVVLDTTIDEELTIEGMYREFVRGLQVARKDAGFNIEDRIFAEFEAKTDMAKKMLEKFAEKIKTEALIKAYSKIDKPAVKQELEVGDEKILIKLSK